MQFNISRFINLIVRDFFLHWKRLGLISLAFYGSVAITMIIISWTSDFKTGNLHNSLFPFVLLIGGFLFTSAGFSDFSNHLRRVQYLSLPASQLEKTLSHLVYVTLGYLLFLMGSYWIFSSILDAVCESIFSYRFQGIAYFSKPNWLLIKLYLVLHALFFVGSIAYNRYASVKTILSVILFGLAILAITFVLFRIIYFDLFIGLFEMKSDVGDVYGQHESIEQLITHDIPKWIEKLFWFALAPLLWVIAYLKMTEKEA